MTVLVYVEHADGELDELSLQAVAFARRYSGGEPVAAVLVGGEGAGHADVLGEHGVTSVHVAEHPELGSFAPRAWGRAVAELADRDAPAAVFAAGTERAAEVLAHAATLTGGVLAANCLEAVPGDIAEITRMRWGGSLVERARLHGRVKLMTVAPHVVAAEPAPAGSPVVTPFTPALRDADLAVRVTAHIETATGGMSLTEAPVVVSGGRGVGSAEGFAPLEELADLLGGAIGCSRAVTSAGWRPHTDQVGQTGTKIAPDLYIPCGISGATQHMAGIKGAKTVLAINSDPEAPMLAAADYAVIGDVAEVVPAITAEIRRAREG